MSKNSAENFPPTVVAHVLRELRGLHQSPLHGIRVMFDEGNLSEVHAEITGPEGTAYGAGLFRLVLRLGPDYPAKPPRATFLTRVFHPNVSLQGGVCVDTLSRDWSSEYGLAHVLTVIRCLLVAPNPDSALNAQAGRMMKDDFEEFSRRAALWTKVHASAARMPPGMQAGCLQADAAEVAPEESARAASAAGGSGPAASVSFLVAPAGVSSNAVAGAKGGFSPILASASASSSSSSSSSLLPPPPPQHPPVEPAEPVVASSPLRPAPGLLPPVAKPHVGSSPSSVDAGAARQANRVEVVSAADGQFGAAGSRREPSAAATPPRDSKARKYGVKRL